MPVVRSEYGPSLPEIVGPRLNVLPPLVRRVLMAAAVVVVLGLGLVLIRSSGSGLTDVLVRKPVAFTLGHRGGLVRVAPHPGEVLRLQTPPSASPQSFTARPLHFPPYSGDVTAAMLSIASTRLAQLRSTDSTLAYRGEGKARINFIPAYQLAFQSRRGGKLVFGRLYFLAPVTPGNPHPAEGIELKLLSQYSKGAPNIASVGTSGLLKAPLRSFRFGTQRP